MRIIKTYEFDNKDYLVSKIEILDRACTFFGRVNDDYRKWAPIMQDLIAIVSPDITHHRTLEERAEFHPNGKPKDNYKYFHHVHFEGDTVEIEDLITILIEKGYIPNDVTV